MKRAGGFIISLRRMIPRSATFTEAGWTERANQNAFHLPASRDNMVM